MSSTLFPQRDEYKGLPLEYGRMPDAGELNALETLKIRDWCSVTCKVRFDAHPSDPLPKDAPAACEKFRQQPDALERAAELEVLPIYCVVTAYKYPYDTKETRTTSNNDVNFATDAPAARAGARECLAGSRSAALRVTDSR